MFDIMSTMGGGQYCGDVMMHVEMFCTCGGMLIFYLVGCFWTFVLL